MNDENNHNRVSCKLQENEKCVQKMTQDFQDGWNHKRWGEGWVVLQIGLYVRVWRKWRPHSHRSHRMIWSLDHSSPYTLTHFSQVMLIQRTETTRPLMFVWSVQLWTCWHIRSTLWSCFDERVSRNVVTTTQRDIRGSGCSLHPMNFMLCLAVKTYPPLKHSPHSWETNVCNMSEDNIFGWPHRIGMINRR